MKFSLLTLFPEMFSCFSYSILKRAQGKKIIQVNLINIRDFSTDKYHTIDGRPYGGGVGMIMKVDVIDRALQSTKCKNEGCKERIVLLDPKGMKYDQKTAKRLSKYDHLIIICGHYEGVDERVKKIVNESISIGDYILTGGEIPAMVLVDSITRLLPGVLKKSEAIVNESFSFQLPSSTFYHPSLEYPQYTRPAIYKKWRVPKILLSGNHQEITNWRKKQSVQLTQKAKN